MERLMLLDGFGLVYRGYYALPPLTTSKGELVNGVFGFCSIVLRGFAWTQTVACASCTAVLDAKDPRLVSARGAEVISEPTTEPWGLREFSIRTPDGHRLMFAERLQLGR